MANALEAAEPLGDLILQGLDGLVFELENEPALGADEMVVVLAGDLVARLAVAEPALGCHAAVHQQAQGAVHGGVADALLALADPDEEIVDGDVIAQAQELIDDELALLGRVQAIVRQVRPPARLEVLDVGGVKVFIPVRHQFHLSTNILEMQYF
ncbi:MAG TPA: hypothetical protein VFG83_09880 [Kofleriaceae bacterium]|nr:hypothetical protein [Kofleriaceae bacterium]